MLESPYFARDSSFVEDCNLHSWLAETMSYEMLVETSTLKGSSGEEPVGALPFNGMTCAILRARFSPLVYCAGTTPLKWRKRSSSIGSGRHNVSGDCAENEISPTTTRHNRPASLQSKVQVADSERCPPLKHICPVEFRRPVEAKLNVSLRSLHVAHRHAPTFCKVLTRHTKTMLMCTTSSTDCPGRCWRF